MFFMTIFTKWTITRDKIQALSRIYDDPFLYPLLDKTHFCHRKVNAPSEHDAFFSFDVAVILECSEKHSDHRLPQDDLGLHCTPNPIEHYLCNRKANAPSIDNVIHSALFHSNQKRHTEHKMDTRCGRVKKDYFPSLYGR